MKWPQIDFIVNDSQRTAEYLCFTAKSISKGFFEKEAYLVLPYSTNLNTKAIYFPDLDYSKKFWKEIAKCKHKNLGDTYPTFCVNEIMSKLPQEKFEKYENIINLWRSKENKFFEITDQLFLGQIKKIRKIDFLLTPYGSLGSYYQKRGKFIATHRTDINPDDIGRKLLYMLVKMATKKTTEIGEYQWYKRNTIVEYLLKNTELKLLLPKVFDSTPKKNVAKLKLDSEVYLKKLGFEKVNNNLIKISQWGKITINGLNIENTFSPKETYVIKFLIMNKNRIVGFDEFIKTPSLYALSKTIENIRVKIRDIGINKELITTVRGKGYQYSN